MTRTDVVRELTRRLGSPSEARWLAEEITGRTGWAGTGGEGLSPEAQRTLENLVARRLAGEPLQYVLGSWAFRSLELTVDSRALIPRPETEQVVEAALAELDVVVGERTDPLVVDLGTGSGAIALAMAAEQLDRRPGIRVVATDADAEALALAEVNRRRVEASCPGVGERVELRRGYWFEALDPSLRGRIDVLVANPPYVDRSEWVQLAPELHHEPTRALVASPGSDGTPGFADVERLVTGAPTWLARPGCLVIELSPPQAKAAAGLARRAGFPEARVARDLAGRPRALVARW